jgi:hypothetical protein
VEVVGDPGNILEGPQLLTGQVGRALLWQDALEPLPPAEVDPEVEADRAGLALEGEPVGGAGLGLEKEARGLSVPSAAAAGGAKVGATGASVEDLEVESLACSVPSKPSQARCTPLVAGRTPLVSQSATASCSPKDGSNHGEYFLVSLSDQDWPPGKYVRPSAVSTEVGLESVESDPLGSPCTSYTGPNSDMQLVPRRVAGGPDLEESVFEDSGNNDPELLKLQQERLALCRIGTFCSSILKKLAPPPLRELESSSSLRAEAQPFTPRRLTRSAALEAQERGKRVSKASTAETVLLKALGICPEELSVDDEHLVG